MNNSLVVHKGNIMNTDHFTITAAASVTGITRQALCIAIKNGRLKATKMGTQWFVDPADLAKYREDRYSRKTSKREDGSLLHDEAKGEYSVARLAELTGETKQRIYYLVRTNQLKSFRVGVAHIIQIEDISSAKGLIESLYQKI